jgi:hypothetical protein
MVIIRALAGAVSEILASLFANAATIAAGKWLKLN